MRLLDHRVRIDRDRVTASHSSSVRLVTDEISNLTEREAMGLRLLDETDPIERRPVVLTESA